jgi:nitrite reductase/ring-hydroxylating ferredoxin subunit/DMSO/TMAO reductase YedYZ heme-binding membrane subunit
MSHGYQLVGWTRDKKRYDAVLLGSLAAYLAGFVGTGAMLHPDATAESLLIRALGTAAFALLHLVLAIGPLARLDPRFLPLLYNRRHLGVTLFLVGLAHALFVLFQYHALGDINPLVSVLVSNPRIDSVSQFPFEWLGVGSLGILFLMAATSHDFWLKNLGPGAWKALHMGVYAAWALLVLHVLLGVLQAEVSPVYLGLLLLGVGLVAGLHLLAAARTREPILVSVAGSDGSADGFVDCCSVDEIPEKRARIVTLSGERVAIFRYDGSVSAVSNVCRHQHGPLGEGRIVDGCITCPWHGYQYRPEDGASPPPFTEKVPTFAVRVRGGRVWVHPEPHAPGTRVEPALIGSGVDGQGAPSAADFYIGWSGAVPPALGRWLLGNAVAVAGAALLLGPLLAVPQQTFGPSRFEFGHLRTLEGDLLADPVPHLSVPLPAGGARSYLLVGQGKHGVPPEALELAGHRVRLRGTLAYRGDQTLFELAAEPPADLGAATHAPVAVPEGEVTLEGEIVDSKCFLGVMNPGNLKPHRACAVRCISGGIPPLLLVRDGEQTVRHVLLTGPGGEAIGPELLDYVAEPVRISGRLERMDDLFVLRAHLDSLARL